MSSIIPSELNGGCLCGEVQFVIKSPPSWKPETHNCLCTQCRKFTGGMIAPFLTVELSWVEFSKKATLKTYESTPGFFRKFCEKCGSSMSWQVGVDAKTIYLHTGTIGEGEGGKFGLRGQLGAELAIANKGKYYCENNIPGVTDIVVDQGEGLKYKRNWHDELMP